jgi:hypothetical protein
MGLIETPKRFVAWFDIMGFKDLVLRNKHQHILLQLESLKEVLGKLENANSNTMPYLRDSNIEEDQTRSFTFSDSIAIFSKSDHYNDLLKIILDSYYLLRKAIEIGICIKGAFSHGEITVDFDNSLFFGQPIIDAYLLHDELEMYNIIMDNNFERRYKELVSDNDPLKSIIHFYKTPLKSGKITHGLLQPTKKDHQKQISNLKELYLNVSGRPRIYIDNTLEFLDTLHKEQSIDNNNVKPAIGTLL